MLNLTVCPVILSSARGTTPRSADTEAAPELITAMTPDGGDPSADSRYRWTCPICGQEGSGVVSSSEDPVTRGVEELRAHLMTTVDEGHGPFRSLPRGHGADSELIDHIEVQ